METQQILSLWRRAKQRGDSLFLATLVHVQGSSYRKPGARMLVSSSGERAGTISGGCLEKGIAKKIDWLTQAGPLLQRFQSSFDEEDSVASYGLGCNGTLWILMEAGDQVIRVLEAIERAWELSSPSAQVIQGFSSDKIRSIICTPESRRAAEPDHSCSYPLGELAIASRSAVVDYDKHSDEPDSIALPILSPPHLHIFGAGDDAQPIARIALELGWRITVLDGRSNLLQSQRFPSVQQIQHLEYERNQHSPSLELASNLDLTSGDLAVLVTHSYEQDRALLKRLLPMSLCYLGLLGPLHRTNRLLAEVCDECAMSTEEAMERLHAPVGLRIGAGSPGVIALAIVAEMQATLAGHPRLNNASCKHDGFRLFHESSLVQP